MLDGLALPPYAQIKHLEGTGNFAVKKYYQWPYRYFYRKKLKMIVGMMRKSYDSILDFGSGSGVFGPELCKHSTLVVTYEKDEYIDKGYDLVVCASVLEFTELPKTLGLIRYIMNPNAELIVASPMKSWLSKKYFGLINDKSDRIPHTRIISEIGKFFKIEKIEYWNNLYFCLKAVKCKM